MVGCAIDTIDQNLDWERLITVAVAISLLYMGGMAMNDLFDEKVDRRERPERPIPSGRISRGSATVFTLFCLAAGIGILARFGGPTLYLGFLLLALITCYNAIHKKFSGSFPADGGLSRHNLCRRRFDRPLATRLVVCFGFRSDSIPLHIHDHHYCEK